MGRLTDEIFSPQRAGYYGEFGGAFVPEILRNTLDELIEIFDTAREDPQFWNEFVQVMRSYSCRPTPITFLQNLTDELGGAQVHATSGVIDNLAEDEHDAFDQIKRFLSYLPTSVYERTPRYECNDSSERMEQDLLTAVPCRATRPRKVMRKLSKSLQRHQVNGPQLPLRRGHRGGCS